MLQDKINKKIDILKNKIIRHNDELIKLNFYYQKNLHYIILKIKNLKN